MTPSGSNELSRAPTLDFFQLHLGAYTPPANSDVGAESLPAGKRALARAHFAERLYRNVVLLALPILALLLIHTPLQPVALLGVPLLFGLRWIALASPFPHTRVNFVILVLLLAIAFGMLRAPVLRFTIEPVAHFLAGIVTLYIVVDYAERPSRAWNVAAGLALLGVGIALATPFITQPAEQKFFDVSFLFNPNFEQFFAVANPDAVAGALAALIPLAIALIMHEQREMRWVGAIALAPLAVMLVVLQSRGAFFALAVGLFLFAVLYRRWLLVVIPIVMLIMVVLFGVAAQDYDLPPINFDPSNTAREALEGRTEVWHFAAGLLVEQPLGIGVNAYTQYAKQVGGDFLTLPQTLHAHNLFLQVGLDTGLVGLAAFTVLFTYAFYASWHAYRNMVKRPLAMGLLAALAVILISGTFEVSMWSNKAVIILWAMFGMAVVMGRYGARRRARAKK